VVATCGARMRSQAPVMICVLGRTCYTLCLSDPASDSQQILIPALLPHVACPCQLLSPHTRHSALACSPCLFCSRSQKCGRGALRVRHQSDRARLLVSSLPRLPNRPSLVPGASSAVVQGNTGSGAYSTEGQGRCCTHRSSRAPSPSQTVRAEDEYEQERLAGSSRAATYACEWHR